jgi:putative transcriptional regulator
MFLVAAPGLQDPNFSQTVVLICEHSGEGAFGLIINRVLMNSIRPLGRALGFESIRVDLPVYFGGPVKPEQGYVLYAPFNDVYGAMRIGDDLGVTASKEILMDIAAGRGPELYMFALGFSGWAPNQVEEELMTDSWLVIPRDDKIIFSARPQDRWRMAGESIGVDFSRYVEGGGTA